MVKHRVAEHQVEALVGERQRLGVGAGRTHVEPQPLRVAAQVATIPGEMSVQVASRDDPGQQQIEAEVTGAGADLERALVAVVELRAEHLAQLAEHLGPADLAEVDAPLGVVVSAATSW